MTLVYFERFEAAARADELETQLLWHRSCY